MDNFSKYIDEFTSDMNSENRILIIRFFLYFSRFEYAMKSSSYGELKWNPCYYDAAWSRLDKELQKNSYFKKSSKAIGQTLLFDPPRKMINQNEFENWLIKRSVIQWTKVVRNNLFHWGKFHWSPMESDRNINLIKESLAILKLIIEDADMQFQDCDSLRAHFNEYI